MVQAYNCFLLFAHVITLKPLQEEIKIVKTFYVFFRLLFSWIHILLGLWEERTSKIKQVAISPSFFFFKSFIKMTVRDELIKPNCKWKLSLSFDMQLTRIEL